MNSAIKIAGFAYRNVIFAKRNFFTFFEILFWPFVAIISVGIMGTFLKFQADIMNFILTGAIASGILQVAQLDVAYSMLYDVWSKSSKHTFLAPVSHTDYLAGGWIVGIIRGTLVFLLMYVFSRAYFGFTLPALTATVFFLAGVFLT
ncbi:MAG: ABC transporter permease, partial [Candidatus Omnitrophica bacterium]|nr:ABC transporter permease [Candidatus Omnitrophota bacterium]